MARPALWVRQVECVGLPLKCQGLSERENNEESREAGNKTAKSCMIGSRDWGERESRGLLVSLVFFADPVEGN